MSRINKNTGLPACGNPDCGCSTGICESITFGTGDLDPYGYWENPCGVCAQAFDDDRPNRYARMRDRGMERGELPEITDEYIRTAEWVNRPAWPYGGSPDAEEVLQDDDSCHCPL